MKRLLITGEAGFLGSHLCDRLIKDGADVLCVDNFFTGSVPRVARAIFSRCLHERGDSYLDTRRYVSMFLSRPTCRIE